MVKNLSANAGGTGLTSESGRSPGEENGNPSQCSYLENSMDRRVWKATVHRVVKNQTQLCTYTYIKQIPNKNPLYSTRYSTQYSVVAYMGKESKKKTEYMYVYN